MNNNPYGNWNSDDWEEKNNNNTENSVDDKNMQKVEEEVNREDLFYKLDGEQYDHVREGESLNQKIQEELVGVEERIPQKEESETIKFEAFGGFWRRLAAASLTMLIVFLIFVLIFVGLFFAIDDLFMTVMRGPESLLNIKTISIISIGILALLSFYFYNIYLYFKKGTTITYKIFGMRIIYSETGQKPPRGILWGRFAVKYFGLLLVPVNLIYTLASAIMIGRGSNKQAIHDVQAETVVVIDKVKKTWLVWVLNIITLAIPVVGIIAGGLGNFINPEREIAKSEDVIVRTEVSNHATQASIYYLNNYSSYSSYCDEVDPRFNCNDSEHGFMVSGDLVSGDRYCVDASGYMGEITDYNDWQITCKE